MFRAATREQLFGRAALCGPAGSGKSKTALRFAFALAGPTGRVAAIDTEHGSLRKYQGEVWDGRRFDFEVAELHQFSPTTYTECIRYAGRSGFDVLVIDSLSHAWDGAGGALEIKDRKGGNSFTAWKDVTPMHREMVEAILAAPLHVVATMRSKMEHILETDDRGKQVPKRVGMKPIQREGMEYEFDLIGDLDVAHQLTVTKSRCDAMDGRTCVKPGAEFLAPYIEWLGQGVSPPVQQGGAMVHETSLNRGATQEQKDEVIRYASRLGIPAEALAAQVQKRRMADGSPCRNFFDLSFGQATEMLDNLRHLAGEEYVPF